MNIVSLGVHQPYDPIDKIAYITKRTRLRAITVNCQLVPAQCLDREIRNHAAIVLEHPLAIRVENPDDTSVDAVLTMVIHHQRLGDTFAFVIAAAQADRIYVPKIIFSLWVD